MAVESSIYNLIFKEILGLTECSATAGWEAMEGVHFGCVTGDPAHDFIFALLLPHVIIAIFLFLFSGWGNLRQQHKGLSSLLGISAYIFIVYVGWYSTIATFALLWLGAGIIFSFFNFLWSRIIHPTKAGEVIKAAKSIGEGIGSGAGKRKKLRILKRREKELENKLNSASPATKKAYAEKLESVRSQIAQLEAE